jgi:uncharacterized surface protein with fasciclin (FAS1) repeats
MTSRAHRPPSASELPASANSWVRPGCDRSRRGWRRGSWRSPRPWCPKLSTLVAAVKKADRVDSAQGITVFAPTNDAFGALPKPTLDKVLGDPRAC